MMIEAGWQRRLALLPYRQAASLRVLAQRLQACCATDAAASRFLHIPLTFRRHHPAHSAGR